MNNPNTIENQVLTILKENTDARNDDMDVHEVETAITQQTISSQGVSS